MLRKAVKNKKPAHGEVGGSGRQKRMGENLSSVVHDPRGVHEDALHAFKLGVNRVRVSAGDHGGRIVTGGGRQSSYSMAKNESSQTRLTPTG
jgi:hypothetical protein